MYESLDNLIRSTLWRTVDDLGVSEQANEEGGFVETPRTLNINSGGLRYEEMVTLIRERMFGEKKYRPDKRAVWVRKSSQPVRDTLYVTYDIMIQLMPENIFIEFIPRMFSLLFNGNVEEYTSQGAYNRRLGELNQDNSKDVPFLTRDEAEAKAELKREEGKEE